MTDKWTKPAPREARLDLPDGGHFPLVPHYEGLNGEGLHVWGLYLAEDYEGDALLVDPAALSLWVDVIPGQSSVYVALDVGPEGLYRVLRERERVPG